ncbi:MAG: F0F1 ATP synthase subunit B [Patescibacteria group bacterium]|nr:F0F1 ATP synthase subunit B [Patescibacteria group bacterium]
MDTLIETFHIDIKLLLAQMINFAIVISVLYFFALKPLTKVMKDRTERIEKSLEDAKKIDEKLEKAEEAYIEKLNQAKKEAGLILEKAGEQVEEKREAMIKKAKEDIGQIINEGKEKNQKEKEITLKEIKSEVADLVTLAMEKVLDKKMDAKKDKELIRKAIK